MRVTRMESTVTIAGPPDRSIEFDAVIGPMRPRCFLTFEPTDAGTRVAFRGDSSRVGPFKLLASIFNRKGQQVWDQRLARVKGVLEG